MEKHFIVHEIGLLQSFHSKNELRQSTARKAIVIIESIKKNAKKLVDVDAENIMNPTLDGDVYIISEKSAQIAAYFILAKDIIYVYGAFKDVCVKKIYDDAIAIGATAYIVPDGSMDTECGF